MVFIAGSIIIGSALTAGSAIIGAKQNKKAITTASNNEVAAQRESIAYQEKVREENAALFAHYLGDEAQARAYTEALFNGRATLPGGQEITRDAVVDLINATPQMLQAFQEKAQRDQAIAQEFAAQQGINTQAFASLVENARANLANGQSFEQAITDRNIAEIRSTANQQVGEINRNAERQIDLGAQTRQEQLQAIVDKAQGANAINNNRLTTGLTNASQGLRAQLDTIANTSQGINAANREWRTGALVSSGDQFRDETAIANAARKEQLAQLSDTFGDRIAGRQRERDQALGIENTGLRRDLDEIGAQYGAALDLANRNFANLTKQEQDAYNRARGLYGEEFNAAKGLAGRQFDAASGLARGERDRALDTAADNRRLRRADIDTAYGAETGFAQDDYARQIATARDQYGNRKALTDRAIDNAREQARVAQISRAPARSAPPTRPARRK
jgi:predicted DNA-binding protein YlxM (UPF0122 family)